MSHTITLYVDGACRGNPGLGGWGAYIVNGQQEHKICGGEDHTTNNRMELTAAIEGILFCDKQDKLVIYTDSKYVKQGITEWIHGWKKKNWKDVKNPDLWQKLDEVCQGRDIEWHWVKGHAGHPGNEMADQLANLGADETLKKSKQSPSMSEDKKKSEPDWLLDDPFGLDLAESEEELEYLPEEIIEVTVEEVVQTEVLATDSNEDASSSDTSALTELHPQIVITPAKLQLHGPRQLILDTETTGFYYQDGDRIIEVGALEMINRKLTGSSIHIYINPKTPVGDSVNVHGITDEFLQDKPLFEEISQVLFDYLHGAEIIAHNATFDMNFLDMEFKRAGFKALSEVCEVTDTLALAKSKHPGQKNSLDALVRRYEIPQRDRTFHGALLDAEILSDVYLAMTGGQVSFDIDALSQSEDQNSRSGMARVEIELPVILPSEQELQEHENWVKQFEEKHGTACLFAK
ncbi:DNA polymerase III subunit epsilon [Acinetobacter lwoffii]|uniref:Ribonuclease H n=1 Tax=Acinetobacter lwoffii TaxID=28090 RepID=A0AAW8AUY8_ACILW|nr:MULTISPECIES: DNA polymerase III subunit epsilon [Pseudomonadota]MCU4450673.1 DNA polymerase III subunit epsilon [Acinetobacter lwoffii]MDP1369894.1 DNA polymerase III subunit epsilon [Acinetobacter lwoffii]MDP1389397.1 DNA polymerase III subunit epsilon [Acinetobacter lwoffii]MDP1447049.1 DNA polymerase III subunit epsilon [Acinetobacter lwoffii]NGP41477.1 DNA polymerase III subunit epsilon [Acinetobacter lwoffii]